MDRYRCFDELRRFETEGRDYRIRLHYGESNLAIIAPHGGKIERGTSQITEAIAGDKHAFYLFEGLKESNNHHLHITSDRFDEPAALMVAEQAHTVITIHGAKGGEQKVYTGGLNSELEQLILEAMNDAGFRAMHDPSPTRQGRGVTNICNRGGSGKGVQVELTQGLRKHLFTPVDDGTRWFPNELFGVFVMAMRSVLDDTGKLQPG